MKNFLLFIIVLLIFFLFNNNAYSQFVVDSLFVNKKIQLEIGFATALAMSSEGFFESYQSDLFKGKANSFKSGVQFHGAIKWQHSAFHYLGVSVDYFQSKIQDLYTFEGISSRGFPFTRNYGQSIIVNTIPIFLTWEYLPIISQFQSYYGIGAGLSLGDITWWEQIQSDLYQDKRIGGKHIDENVIAPAIKAYTGVKLGFDDKKQKNLLNSLTLEVSAIHIHRNTHFFSRVKDQFDENSDILNKKTIIIPFFISIAAYISVNLDRL